MSFPNPDNYARDCDCGTAGANTTPPPVAIQAEIDSLDTRVTALEETNDVIVSSGGIANLTTAQQALIREGSIVVTTDGKRWVYSGAGSKVLEASYIELSDLTIGSTANLPLITGAGGVITAGSFGSSANTFCQGDDVRVDHVRPLGANNVFVGNTALASGSLSGVDNTATGQNALFSNTTGASNTATGASALAANTAGLNNTATGASALLSNTTGSNNTAVGYRALRSNTSGSQNTAVGYRSLQANTIAGANTAVGFDALFFNTAFDNTAVGSQALVNNTTGPANTACGTRALQGNQAGGLNAAFGYEALYFNNLGFNNSAFGYAALRACSGFQNTAVGHTALGSLTNANNNVAVGFQALTNTTTGTANVGVGTQAGSSIMTGSSNTTLGHGANVDLSSAQNRIALGRGAISQADGEVAIGSAANPVLTAGTAGAITNYLVVRINGTQYKMPLYAI